MRWISPNRSRKGADRSPALVVAPTRVNLGRLSRMDLAAAPLPIRISMAKSSMAGYRTSSTCLFRRWISSTKRMSPSFSPLRMAAISPGFSMAGPLVTLRLTPISLAMMPDRVVLPSPGGP